MDKLPEFKYIKPGTISEVLSIIADERERPTILAGGTDVLVQMRQKKNFFETLIDIKGIKELCLVTGNSFGMKIGSCITMATLHSSQMVDTYAPLLAEAARNIGSPQIQNRATVGGNLCNASPAADTAVALMALEAILTLESQKGIRRISIDNFFKGPGNTDLERDEILKEIEIPPLISGTVHTFLKFTMRKEMDLAIVNMAMLISTDKAGRIKKMRVAFGAVAPTPIRIRSVEQWLQEKQITREIVDRASNLIIREMRPISDLRASAEYRVDIARVLFKRGIQIAAQQQLKNS